MPDEILTRELLETGGLDRMVADCAPDLRRLSPHEQAETLQNALSQRPAGDAWVFGYGSLIWNPTFTYAESRVAVVRDWHRSFCLSVFMGRGTVDLPGLVLGLDQSGSCTGVAFRIAEQDVEVELAVLWKREMLGGAYVPRWLDVFDLDGERFGSALVFTIDPLHPNYAGDLERNDVVQRLATASGFLGSCAQYLFQTCLGLRDHGLVDPDLESLSVDVAANVRTGSDSL